MTNDDRPTSRILGSPALRWAVPVAAVVAIGGGLALTSGSADAAAKLPHKEAAQLLADVAQTAPRGFSGTVVETARLGLPDLPGMAGGTSLQSLVTGSHTARVWYGPDKKARSLIGSVRVAVDAATSVPLRLQVFARGATDPAFETAFTEVQFQQPDASVFRFTPPKDAKVTEGTTPAAGTGKPAAPQVKG